jgi:hypothetical protein
VTKHILNLPDSDANTITITCSCGFWMRAYDLQHMPPVEDIESDHEEHRQRAGAEELKTTPPATTGLDALVNMTRAMGDAMKAMAEWGATIEAFMTEFTKARKEAAKNGVGVVVVREPDGSLTSTPSVYVEDGAVLFIDSPATTDAPPQLRLVPDPAPAIPQGTVMMPTDLFFDLFDNVNVVGAA